MLQMVMLETEPVELCISIFGITHKGMSDRSKVRTYLMSPACDQSYFQKCYFAVIAKRGIKCLHWL